MCCATLWPDKGGRRLMSRFLCNTAGSLSGWQFRSTGDSRLSGFPAARVGWRERGGADLDRLRIIPVPSFRVPGRRRRPPASCSSPVCVSAFLPFSSFFPVPSGAFQMRSYFVPMVFLLIRGGSSGRPSTGVFSAGGECAAPAVFAQAVSGKAAQLCCNRGGDRDGVIGSGRFR